MLATIQQGADRNNALFNAVQTGNAAQVEAFLLAGVDPNTRDANGTTLLHYAVRYDKPEVLDILLAADTNVNASNHQNETPLHVATLKLNPLSVRKLIAAGARVTVEDCHRKTPLHNAALISQNEMALMLLTAGADPNARDNEKNTPLHTAAFNGNTVLVEYLLSHVGYTNVYNTKNETPLHCAVNGEHILVVEQLVNARAEAFNTNSLQTMSAYQLAVFNGRNDIAQRIKKMTRELTDLRQEGDTVVLAIDILYQQLNHRYRFPKITTQNNVVTAAHKLMDDYFCTLDDQELVADEWVQHNQISAETYRSHFAPHIESALHEQFDPVADEIPDYVDLIPQIVKQLRYLPPSSDVLRFHQNRIASRQLTPSGDFMTDLPASFTPAFQQMSVTTETVAVAVAVAVGEQQTQLPPQYPAHQVKPIPQEQSPVQTPRWFCCFHF